VARLNKELTQILQSTYLGGKKEDYAEALAIHPQTGEVYVVGKTESTNLPKTAGGAQASKGGSSDAFVARLNKELTQILQATYLGGRGGDEARALAIHPKTGEVYVAGETYSEDFPKTTGGAQVSLNGGHDPFVARLNKELTQILQATYLGGSSSWETADALVIHPQTGEVYVAGWTASDDFPKTTGGAQPECNCIIARIMYGDAFVARLTADLAAGRRSSDGGGYHMTGSVSSTASFWNILLLLSVPVFALARRIRSR
jgi:hypothetical protein